MATKCFSGKWKTNDYLKNLIFEVSDEIGLSFDWDYSMDYVKRRIVKKIGRFTSEYTDSFDDQMFIRLLVIEFFSARFEKCKDYADERLQELMIFSCSQGYSKLLKMMIVAGADVNAWLGNRNALNESRLFGHIDCSIILGNVGAEQDEVVDGEDYQYKRLRK